MNQLILIEISYRKNILIPAKSIISSCDAVFNASPYSSSRSMAILSSCSVLPLVSGATHYNKISTE